MNSLRKLLLPVGFGIAAAMVNAGILKEHVEPEYLVGVRRDLPAGAIITEADLMSIPVPHSRANLEGHFWLWSKRHPLLDGLPVPVNLRRGDLMPREPFLRHAAAPVSVIPGEVILGVRVRQSTIAQRTRHLMQPGSRVSVRLLHDETVYRNLRLAWIEFVDQSTAGGESVYQLGIAVPADDPLGAKILRDGLASVEGMPE
jgi:hypothetical protein